MTLLVIFLVMIMLIAAIAVLILPNMIAAIAASSVVSLVLAIIFAILKAPDVAMTEAVIGAGLGSLILAIGLKRLGYNGLDEHTNKITTEHANKNTSKEAV